MMDSARTWGGGGEEWRQTEERTRCFRREKREDLVKNGIIYELVHSIFIIKFLCGK